MSHAQLVAFLLAIFVSGGVCGWLLASITIGIGMGRAINRMKDEAYRDGYQAATDDQAIVEREGRRSA